MYIPFKSLGKKLINRKRLKLPRYKQYLDKGVVFIHIPKAAGSSVNMSIFGNMGLGHLKARDYVNLFGFLNYKSFFKFTIVRNPYDRFESAYNFLVNGGMSTQDENFTKKYLKDFKDINDFVLNGFTSSKIIQEWVHFVPQYKYVYVNNRLYVDFIGKTENITKDFKYVSNIIGLTSDLQYINKTSNQSIKSSLLNNESKRILADFYNKDFELFEYEK